MADRKALCLASGELAEIGAGDRILLPTLTALTALTASVPSNSRIVPDATQIIQNPMAPLHHDLLAFGAHYTTTYETSTDGTTFTAATLNGDLFAHKENQGVAIVDSTTKAARWTWTDTSWGSGQWLILGHNWSAWPWPTKRVHLESSPDGVTWTTRHDSTYDTIAVPIWHVVDNYEGATRLRLTITWQVGGIVSLSSIRLLTARWGDQGKGSEYELPYTWTKDRWIGIGLGNTVPSAQLHVVGDTIIDGRISNSTVVVPKVVTLTDAATVTVDATLGSVFDLTLAGNRTLANPTGAVNGQRLLFRIRQDVTGGRTLAFGTKYRFGTTITSVTLSTVAEQLDRIEVEYVAADDKFDVVAVTKGY